MSNDFPNIALQARPEELMFYCRNSLVTAKLAGKTPRMALSSELIPERRAWDAQHILKEYLTLCLEVVTVLVVGAKV